MGINTGDLTRRLRGRRLQGLPRQLATWSGEHFGALASATRVGLAVGHGVASVFGDKLVGRLSGGAWKPGMPYPGQAPRLKPAQGDPVVYFPTCGGRLFGPSHPDEASLSDTVQTLLIRAGYAPRLPAACDRLCCGQMLASKGLAGEADAQAEELARALLEASDGGRYPVILDASACSARMKEYLGQRLTVLDFHEFAHDALLPRLRLAKQPGPVALHVNCSVRRSGADAKLKKLVGACVEQLVEPAGVTCCGFGGDRGFVVPELNHHALRKIHAELPAGCASGVSTNRTCEIGLTAETGRNYRSVAYLLEECSREGEELIC